MVWTLFGGLAIAGAAEPDRVAIVVGANQAPLGRAELRYAYDDADRVAQTLIEVGGFAEDAVTVLRDPHPDTLLDTIARLPDADLLVFFYSGHADDTQLFPSGQPLSVRALQQALGEANADLRVGVLDACRGGGWTGTKGLVPAREFDLPAAPPQEGTVYLAASSGTENAHEADVVSGGFFTHHWTAGLRGPADADADGRVTIDESFAYARAYTVRDSTVYAGQTQHPSFKMELRGRDPVVLADLRDQRSTLALTWEFGTVTVHAIETGARVATLAHRDEGYRLALRPGRWLVRRQGVDSIDVVEVELRAAAPLSLSEDDLVAVDDTGLASKGSELRATDLMAPRGGQLIFQGAVGSRVTRMPDAPNDQALITDESWVIGLSDRVSLSPLTPNLGYRVGRRGKSEVLFTAGIINGGFGYSSEQGFIVGGDLGGRVEARLPLSYRVSLQSSWGVAVPATVSTLGGPSRDRVWSRLALGVGWRLSRDVTLHPSVSTGGSSDITPGKHSEAFVFGSTLTRNNRQLPLLQVNLTNGMTLDLHYQARYDIDTGWFNQHILVGTTLASRKAAK